MSKIILNGNDRKYRITCAECGSIIEYSKHETQENKYQNILKMDIAILEIECPVCGWLNNHDESVDVTIIPE